MHRQQVAVIRRGPVFVGSNRGPALNCGSDCQASKFWWIIDSDLSPASTSRAPWRRARHGRKLGLLRAFPYLGFIGAAELGRERSTGFSDLPTGPSSDT